MAGIFKRKKTEEKDLKILVTGANGQLGYDCLRELRERGFRNVRGVDRDELDITDAKRVEELIVSYAPDIVLHNAAYTAVDKAETHMSDCYEVNTLGTRYIALACQKVKAKLMYISTDYVFEGKGTKFYATDDPLKGLSVYGKTKAWGEKQVTDHCSRFFILRVSWVFGINGNNFVRTMLRLADSGKREVSVVSDQVGSPTYTRDLSKLMCEMMLTEKYGIYHATNEGITSWAGFAEAIFRMAKRNVRVRPVTTEEYALMVPKQAPRPLNSRLDKASLTKNGFQLLPDWQNALERFLKEYEIHTTGVVEE